MFQCDCDLQKRSYLSLNSPMTPLPKGYPPVSLSNNFLGGALRSSRTNQAYLFMENEYVVLDYVNDALLEVPLPIAYGCPSLWDTVFDHHGIDSAIWSASKNEMIIFVREDCAVVDCTNDLIKEGPILITEKFPFFEGMDFQFGINAAFESTNEFEAYLFKEDQCALINYSSSPHLIRHGRITEFFPGLRDTIFETGIDAAFASRKDNEAYIFRDDSCAHINFSTFSTSSSAHCIIGEVKKILDTWSCLDKVLPRRNFSFLY